LIYIVDWNSSQVLRLKATRGAAAKGNARRCG
jgi:hypothetical protein